MHPHPQVDLTTAHGVQYPDALLDALPVLRHRPHPHPPIRALSAPLFSDIHLSHLTTHAPDHVLFPFLHGLEGDNEQQNAFFASARPRGDVPRFRGLIWVACDEDGDDVGDVDDLEEDDDDDDYSTGSSLDSFGPTDLDEDVPMQLDPAVEGPMVTGCPPPQPLDKPVLDAVAPLPVPLSAPPAPTTAQKPAFLTSGFRARDLLRVRAETSGTTTHVFAEPKIPDGISLRNFGIQVVSLLSVSLFVWVYAPGSVASADVGEGHWWVCGRGRRCGWGRTEVTAEKGACLRLCCRSCQGARDRARK